MSSYVKGNRVVVKKTDKTYIVKSVSKSGELSLVSSRTPNKVAAKVSSRAVRPFTR